MSLGSACVVQEAPYRTDVAAFACFALLIFMVIGPYMTLKTLPYTGEGSVLRQIGYSLIYVVALFAARAGAHPGRAFALPISLGLALGWCWLSLAWAIDADIAVRRLLLTTLLMLAIFMTVERLKYERTILIIRETMILILIANFLCVVAVPSIGIHQQLDIEGFGLDPELIGNWKGVMVQKNFAGAVCALTIFAFVFDARTIKTWIRFAVVLGSAVFLYFTHAKTSYGLLFLGLAAGWLFQNYNPRFRILLVPALAIAGLIAVGLAISFWSEIAAFFSRPDAFTGRVQIWSVLVAYWKDNWLLGSGYGSFWNIGGNRTPIFHYVKETDWVALVSIGHNGYLDLLAQTGLPGLVLAVIAVVVVPLRNLLSNLNVGRSRGALLMSFLVFCVTHNLLETSLMDRDAIIQMYLMFTIALIGVVTRRRNVPVSSEANFESPSPLVPLARPMRRVSSLRPGVQPGRSQ